VTVTLDERGLLLDGRPTPWISGDVHYWRHPAKDWPMLLERVRALGLQMLCTYIPWSVHEAAPGAFDFGELDPAKAVDRFLDLAGQMGFKVLVRPGPHINAELTYFGFPPRLFDDPRFLARNARGGYVILPALPRAFPVISYAAEAFWQELESWLDALAPILRPRLHPRGPIVGVQLDNECSYFFRTSPYDQDYHPDVRAKWLDFLREKHGDLPAAGAAHGGREDPAERPLPDDFQAAKPEDLPYYLDWMEFRERLLADSLARLRRMWEERGVADVAFFHNYPVVAARSPLNIPLTERTAHFCGVDFYMRRTDFALLKRRLLFLVGQSRLPVSPEFGAGCYHLWPPVEPLDQQFTARAAWMFGLRGINFYMVVERDRWYGSPITRNGGIRPGVWDFYEQHFAFLRRLQPWRLRRVAPVCLLSPREYERLEAASTAVAPLPPLALEGSVDLEDLCYESLLGFERPIQHHHAKLLRGWERALTQLGIPYVIGSTDMDPAKLNAHQVVVCPTFEFLGRRSQELLANFVAAGGSLICGPEAPSLDDAMREFSRLDKYAGRPIERLDCPIDVMICEAGRGVMALVTAPPPNQEVMLAVARQTCARLGVWPVYPTSPPCETSLLRDPEDGREVLFVANPTDRRAVARLGLRRPGERRPLCVRRADGSGPSGLDDPCAGA
jgi:beta-galactosidase